MALDSIVTYPGPGATFTLPLASPALTHSPSSTPSSTLNSPLPINTIQLRRSSYGSIAYHARSPFPGDSPERAHKELAEKHSELAESLKRSVTIVLWHKANTQPFRLRQEISTFPLLCLSEVEPIMSAFGLLANSYIEFYNPDARAWEKEKVCAVRSVESQQRVLFRVCRSLIDSLEDSECPGLDAEIRLQEEPKCAPAIPLLYHPMDTTSARKRSADELLTQPLSKHHRSRSTQSSVLLHPSANAIEDSPPLPKSTERRSEDPIETPVVQPPSPSPTSSPSISTSTIMPALMSMTSTDARPRQQLHYVPHTPISPMHFQPSNFGPMATLPPRANQPIISSESSLAMAVTPPTHTLPLQRSSASESPTRAAPASLPLLSPQTPARANLAPNPNPNPTPSPTPSSTSLPSTSRLLAPNPSADRSSTPAATAAQGTSLSPGAGGAGKAWPHGKYVCEIDAGFAKMEATMAASPTVKQPEAFRRAFGVPHKKSTVCSHKKIWKSAPQDVLAEWRARGREDGALWSEFVRAVEGKDLKRAGPNSGVGAGMGGAVAGAAANGAGAQSAAAFGSPQGGVLHLGPGQRTVPTHGTTAGMGIQPVQGLGVRLDGPMVSLRPPQPPGVRQFFGEQQFR
ncbi:hypothetical protein GSI_00193 [Ganoderma sinense ZZ0214-1]|uniref:Uncharacterized protein n=1 Tax=Ganoderma sinense ZZ0214-1 TaxID=1077348 RepID=A0A2G8SRX8_9APHY|nr:hypothetical protein GSI_00193 [Ganoderma sinense ZZ0214-1]